MPLLILLSMIFNEMDITKRKFIKAGFAFGAGLALNPWPASASVLNTNKTKPVRIGVVGVGSRGFYLTKQLLKLDGVEIPAVCDIDENKILRVQKYMVDAGLKKPDGYARGEVDFMRLCERDDLDIVITATPWEWHAPVCIAAMQEGKHAATEVPAAITEDECWDMVETSEKTGKFCALLENVSYWRNVMTLSKMIHNDVFGELLHSEVSYQHDIRTSNFFNSATLKHYNETGKVNWRLKHHEKRKGNLYPTHALGPVAQWMDINRGDRFDYLVSMSTPSKGLNIAAANEFGENHPLAKKHYAHGDINTTLIKTKKGLTITLYHEIATYRPYHLRLKVQGTRGIYSDTEGIYIHGLTPESHDNPYRKEQWDDFEEADYVKTYEPKLWQERESHAEGSGHGGGDYMVLYRLVEAVRSGLQPDIDVYDAAAWSVVTDLSERSVNAGSKPVNFPDFTKGAWKTRNPMDSIFVQ